MTSHLTLNETISEIETVCHLSQRTDKVYADISSMIGCDPDAPLWELTFALRDRLIKQASMLVGDDYDWIEWFIMENDCGRKGMRASPRNGAKLRPIRTVKQLAQIIRQSTDGEQ